jgi:hypothetical protein
MACTALRMLPTNCAPHSQGSPLLPEGLGNLQHL